MSWWYFKIHFTSSQRCDAKQDPTEVLDGDAILVIWTWDAASGGEESVNVSVAYELQDGLILNGAANFDIETFDGSGDGGSYYPLNEPGTNGKGCFLTSILQWNLNQRWRTFAWSNNNSDH